MTSKNNSLVSYFTIVPHSTTGTSPAQLLMGRWIKTHLDLLRPSLAARGGRAQYHQKRNHDRSSQARQFAIGDPVFFCNFNSGSQWIAGVIIGLRGPVSYTVQLDNERIVRRHVDHIRARTSCIRSLLSIYCSCCLISFSVCA